jgi:sensor histidine kinase regulating citrate/malate metabolism
MEWVKKEIAAQKQEKVVAALHAHQKSTRCKKIIPTISTQAHDRSMVVGKPHHLRSHLPNPKKLPAGTKNSIKALISGGNENETFQDLVYFIYRLYTTH